jgi:hypothetical protein
MDQYIDNRSYYGLFLHYWKSRDDEQGLMMNREPTLCLLEAEMERQNTETTDGNFIKTSFQYY